MKFGLKAEHLELLNQLFTAHLPEQAQVYVYGSRVKGTYHSRSDLDLVVKNTPADRHQIAKLQAAIDDSNFPLLCDLQYYSTINNPSLKDHIDRMGVSFPKRETNKKINRGVGMKEGWRIEKLNDVCTILDSKRKPITKKNRIEGEIPYYGATGVLSYVKDFLFDEKLVLLGEDGAKWESGERSAFIIDGKTWVNNHAHVLKPNRDTLMDQWLVHNLNHQNLMPYITGMTVPKLNQGNMREIEIPVPPLAEQEAIVEVLDKAFAAIDQAKANIQQNIANAKELFQSKLNQIFSQKGDGWVETTLSELIKVKHGFAFKSQFFTTEGEHVLLTPGNYYEKGGYRDRGSKQKYYRGEIPEGYLLEEDDLLLAMTEQAAGLLGSPLLVPKSGRYLHNQRLGLIQRISEQALSKRFLFHAFNTKAFRDEIHHTGTGVKVRHTSPTKICNATINLTFDSKTQEDVVNTLGSLKTQTDALVVEYQTKLASLDELKKSILQKAFAGELT